MISLKEMGEPRERQLLSDRGIRVYTYKHVNGVFIVYIENSRLMYRKGRSFLDLDICVYIIPLSRKSYLILVLFVAQ